MPIVKRLKSNQSQSCQSAADTRHCPYHKPVYGLWDLPHSSWWSTTKRISLFCNIPGVSQTLRYVALCRLCVGGCACACVCVCVCV